MFDLEPSKPLQSLDFTVFRLWLKVRVHGILIEYGSRAFRQRPSQGLAKVNCYVTNVYRSQGRGDSMARILVFDDDLALRTVIRSLLEGAGHEVEVAPDGEAGLDLFREGPGDIVITDIRMPNKTGNEAIMELRIEYPDVKIIVITGGGAIGTDMYMRVAEKLGADFTLSKPFDPADLLQIVNEALGSGVS